MLKYLIIWVPKIFIAILNGTARDLAYKNYTSELAARQISTISLIILFGIYFRIIFRKYPIESEVQAFSIGAMWLFLTLVFEFSMGRFGGHSWEYLFNEYNFMKGKIWILIPIWVAIAPYIFYRIYK